MLHSSGPPTSHTLNTEMAHEAKRESAARRSPPSHGSAGSQLMVLTHAVYPSCTHHDGRHRLAADCSGQST